MLAYSPALAASIAATLSELSRDELLTLVPDTKHKTAEGRALLAAELKRRISPNQKP